MKIAIMSRWNATCGVSLHAELVGRKFRELGHEIVVYAPTIESADADWHHRHIDVEDEPWVRRVFEETEEYLYPFGGAINFEEIVKEEYDAFIVESSVRFPVNEFKRVSKKIREKAPLIMVMHLGYIRDTEPFMDIEWDKIVVFDKRYVDEILSAYGDKLLEKIVEIPYPYLILDGVKPIKSDFEEGEKLFTFGRQPGHEYVDYVRALRALINTHKFRYLIVRSDGLLPFHEEWLTQRRERPELRKLYGYLMGADIHLLPKGDTRAVVVSSTIAQTLYSGTPTIVPDTRHFELLPAGEEAPIMKYRLGDTRDLRDKLLMLMEDEDLRKKLSSKAREYALRYSDEVVAKAFIKLIKSSGG